MATGNSTDIFSEIPKLDYSESTPSLNAEEFEKVVISRRSVRVYTPEIIPDEIVHKCIDLALLAPNSSNLQCWEFYRVKSAEKRKLIVEACLSQPAAKTSAELIVCVARTKSWPVMRKKMLDVFSEQEKKGMKIPLSAITYYKKLVPFVYSQGPLSLWGFIKKIIMNARGLVTPTPREPTSHSDMKLWAAKTSALACENLMLAFRAYGYDTCPMEGFDSARVRRALSLPRDAHITMIISAGKRAQNGVYGPRIRFERELFVKEV